MKRKLFFLLFAVCVAVPGLFSAPLESLLEPVLIARLMGGGVALTETQARSPILRLLPNFPELWQFVLGIITELEPSVSVETLYLYNKPVSSNGWSDAQRTALFNQILALSTLTGIQYYSASRQAMRVFYESSVVIDDPQTKRPLPDPVFERPPQSFSLYARQKDLTFGDNIYRYDFFTFDGAFFFAQENLTAMNAGIFPAVGKNRLRSVFAIMDCGDSLLIYSISLVKAVSVPGMLDRIGDSFGNRVEAVLKWFIGRADAVFSSN